MEHQQPQRPTCAVGGMINRSTICGAVVVGGHYCSHPGECQNKVAPVAGSRYPADLVESDGGEA
ncbi:hypothetical protein [Vogesella sp. XCS3]|uniref:hypothetical protein n=1 Tax=Vogesella sp. XCS3 TaxID=2877939 RepID=UPI001D0AD7CD|nr:hypothetical protein [Vogesella sp. XCS3]UDM17882.1 hypothetical protein LCH97_04245 [Vogesella sp. XCS3]